MNIEDELAAKDEDLKIDYAPALKNSLSSCYN